MASISMKPDDDDAHASGVALIDYYGIKSSTIIYIYIY